MNDLVHFIDESLIRFKVEAAYALHFQHLSQLLPYAEIHHIGSTAVPGSLTKGDLDLQVRVSQDRFKQADFCLAGAFERNIDSAHSLTFSSFKNDNLDLSIGIQLTAIAGPEDYFHIQRDYFIANPQMTIRYNALKLSHESATMTDYRLAKSVFMQDLLLAIYSQRGTEQDAASS